MKKNRLEAFSDAVIAIIITIMVLELKIPKDGNLTSLIPLIEIFLSYVLSFVYLGIYWNNHHHLFHIAKRVNGKILWTNLFLRFWLSLIPFVSAWAGESHFSKYPMMFYGGVLLMAAISYYILQINILSQLEKDSKIIKAFGKDIKGKISPILYLIGIPMSIINTWVAMLIFTIVALLWLIPDKRIEDAMELN